MKRITAIFFVLLANICILAHAFIPHHHHDRMAVAIMDSSDFYGRDHHSHDNGHSHDDSHSHYHHNHRQHDSHQHDSHSEECLLNESLFVLLRSQESGSTVFDTGQDEIIFDLDYVGIDDIRLSSRPITPITYYSYRANIPPGIVICSHGLRAPPHC